MRDHASGPFLGQTGERTIEKTLSRSRPSPCLGRCLLHTPGPTDFAVRGLEPVPVLAELQRDAVPEDLHQEQPML